MWAEENPFSTRGLTLTTHTCRMRIFANRWIGSSGLYNSPSRSPDFDLRLPLLYDTECMRKDEKYPDVDEKEQENAIIEKNSCL